MRSHMGTAGIPTPGTTAAAGEVERRPLETAASTDPAPFRAIDWRPNWEAEADRKETDKGSDCSWCCLSNGFVTTRLGCLRGAGCGSGRIPVRGERPGTDVLVSLHSTAHGLDEGCASHPCDTGISGSDSIEFTRKPARASSRGSSPKREPTRFTPRFTASLIEGKRRSRCMRGRRDNEPRQSSLAPLITQER